MIISSIQRNQSNSFYLYLIFPSLGSLSCRTKNNYPSWRMKSCWLQEMTRHHMPLVSRPQSQDQSGQQRIAWMTSQKAPWKKTTACWTRRIWTLLARIITSSGHSWELLSLRQISVRYHRHCLPSFGTTKVSEAVFPKSRPSIHWFLAKFREMITGRDRKAREV